MADVSEGHQVQDNPQEHRYEVTLEGNTAFIEYRRSGHSIILIHTDVPPAFEGRGIASQLAKAALDNARAAHLQVIPLCPFVATYIKRHKEYQDLVAEEFRSRIV
jgi:predicted GNAT family acetyltransferase